jgi:hypothetical protein
LADSRLRIRRIQHQKRRVACRGEGEADPLGLADGQLIGATAEQPGD